MIYNYDQHNDNDDHYYHHQQHVPIEGQRVLMALVVRHKLYLQHYVMIIIMFNKGRRRRSRGRNCRNALLMTLCTEQLSRFRSAFLFFFFIVFLLMLYSSSAAVLLLAMHLSPISYSLSSHSIQNGIESVVGDVEQKTII